MSDVALKWKIFRAQIEPELASKRVADDWDIPFSIHARRKFNGDAREKKLQPFKRKKFYDQKTKARNLTDFSGRVENPGDA